MRKYIILFGICLVIFLVHFYKSRHGIYGDGNGYFTLAYTLFFHPNLDFTPIYQYLSAFHGSSSIFSRVFWDTSKTVTGVQNCPWLIGTALFWLPSIFIMYLVNILLPIPVGLSYVLYEIGCGVTGILLVITGLFFLEKYVRNYFDTCISSRVIIAIFFASQLFYYTSFEPALSHEPGFFLVCVFLYLLKKNTNQFLRIGLLGTISGLLLITRMGDLLVLVPFILYESFVWIKKSKFSYVLFFTALFIMGIVPQLLLQKAVYGDFFANVYIRGEKGAFTMFTFTSVWNQLLSAKGGFFLWSPLYLIAAAGLIKASYKEKLRQPALLSMSTIVLYILFISSWQNAIPAGFGNRFFISLIPLFSIGLGYIFKRYKGNILLLTISCLLWNILLLVTFYF